MSSDISGHQSHRVCTTCEQNIHTHTIKQAPRTGTTYRVLAMCHTLLCQLLFFCDDIQTRSSTQKSLFHLTVPGAVEFIMAERHAASAGVAARAGS